jgi:hypothetical protein
MDIKSLLNGENAATANSACDNIHRTSRRRLSIAPLKSQYGHQVRLPNFQGIAADMLKVLITPGSGVIRHPRENCIIMTMLVSPVVAAIPDFENKLKTQLRRFRNEHNQLYFDDRTSINFTGTYNMFVGSWVTSMTVTTFYAV